LSNIVASSFLSLVNPHRPPAPIAAWHFGHHNLLNNHFPPQGSTL
jgi:hypothetical protein